MNLKTHAELERKACVAGLMSALNTLSNFFQGKEKWSTVHREAAYLLIMAISTHRSSELKFAGAMAIAFANSAIGLAFAKDMNEEQNRLQLQWKMIFLLNNEMFKKISSEEEDVILNALLNALQDKQIPSEEVAKILSKGIDHVSQSISGGIPSFSEFEKFAKNE